jgi:tetratricopeptide (TPR) repeat protein
VLGYIFTLIISPIYAFLSDKSYLHKVKKFDKAEIFKSKFPIVNRIFGESAVISLSKNRLEHLKNKMKGLVFMAEHPTKQNISLIKGLLSDKDNEIRLYSFAVINSLETELNKSISKTEKLYKNQKNQKLKSKYAHDLAKYYFTFIDLGLSDDEAKEMIYKEIIRYLNEALKDETNNAQNYLLFGKVSFIKKDYDKALKFFNKASENGVKKSSLLPFYAEIFYQQKRFKEIKNLFKNTTKTEISTEMIPIHNIWSQS